jgi:hypothetical protein
MSEFDDLRPIYSRQDVNDAYEYGIENVTIHPDEVGIDVFMTLFKEKMYEYLYKVESMNYESSN